LSPPSPQETPSLASSLLLTDSEGLFDPCATSTTPTAVIMLSTFLCLEADRVLMTPHSMCRDPESGLVCGFADEVAAATSCSGAARVEEPHAVMQECF
jgi:hypothetical protein